VSSPALDALFRESWDQPRSDDWGAILERSLTRVTAIDDGKLVGFTNVAWDGGSHAFLLDTTVHPSARRKGIGTLLVQTAIREARRAGVEWLHVDYEPHLAGFHRACGFRETTAGLIRVTG
jgi:GNAT superfamily N-acetyltransferase